MKDKIVSITKRYFTPQDISDKFEKSIWRLYGYIIETEQKIFALGVEEDGNRNCPAVFSGSNGEIAIEKDICDENYQEIHEDIKRIRGKGGRIILDEDEVLADHIGADIVEFQLNGEGFEIEWDSVDYQFAQFIDLKTTKGVLSFCAYNCHNGYYGVDVFLGFVDKNTNEFEQRNFRA